MLNSLLLLLVLPLYTVVAGSIGIPWTLITKDARFLYWLGKLGVRIGYFVSRIRIVLHDEHKLGEDPHFIYMINHNSNLDAPALWIHIPSDVRVLLKKEVFKLPVLSRAMRIGGFVPVDRSNREAAIESVRRAAEIAREGASFLIAPEGTRSRTGKLQSFKKGGFHMAIESEVPILPVSIIGAYELMPPGSYAIRSGTIDIYFHDPIATKGLDPADRTDLMERVRAPLERTLEEHGYGSD